MKRFIVAFLIPLLLVGQDAFAQKAVQTVGGGNATISSGPVTFGNTNKLTIASGATLQIDAGAIVTGLPGSGTVNSVALAVPDLFAVTGSPITTSGTITLTFGSGLLPKVNGGTGTATPSLVAGTNVSITGTWPNQTINASGGSGSGTVTDASVTTANGVSGTVTGSGTATLVFSFTLGAITPTTVRGLTITTTTGTFTLTNAKVFSVTDNITLSSDGTGTRTLNIGAGGTLAAGAFQPQTVITATAPVTASNGGVGATTVAIPAATSSVNGYLSSADWTTFNSKQAALTYSTGLTLTGSTLTANVVSVAGRTGAVTLTSTDVGLASVTNDVQTKAAVFPNTGWLNGQLAIGNTTSGTVDRATITAGANVTVTNSPGGISIAATSNGTVTSVAETFTGGLISVSGSPITTTGTLALTVAGTSGGIPYFLTSSSWATSPTLALNNIVVGGGAGGAPSTTTTGSGVIALLGLTVDSAGGAVSGNGTGTLANKTMSATTFNGIMTYNGTSVITAKPMAALAIDVTNGWNSKTIAVDSTVTFSGTPAASIQNFGVFIKNSDTSAHTVTIPSSYSMGRQTAITTVPIVASGKLFLRYAYDSSDTTYYLMSGDPAATIGTGVFVLDTNATLTTPTFIAPTLGTPASGNLSATNGYQVGNIVGTVATTQGGTGQIAYLNGQLLIGNTTSGGLDKATLTAGSGITITNAAGSITITSSGGGGNASIISSTTNAVVVGQSAGVVTTLASTGTSGNPLLSGGSGLPAFGVTMKVDSLSSTASTNLTMGGGSIAGANITIESSAASGNITVTPLAGGITRLMGGNIVIGDYGQNLSVAGTTALEQIAGTTGSGSAISISRFSSGTTTQPKVIFGKSAGTTVGNFTAVANNTSLGQLIWAGADGTDLSSNAARIEVLSDNTVSTGVVPGRIDFFTSNSTGTLTRALSLASDQSATFSGNIVAVGTITGNSVTAATTTNLTLSGGSSGANIVLGQGSAGNVTINPASTGQTNISSVGGNVVISPSGTYPALATSGSGMSILSNTTTILQLESAGTNTIPTFLMARAAGNLTTPTSVTAGNILSQIQSRSYNGSGFATSTSIKSSATENHGASALGSKLTFLVTPNGSTGASVIYTMDQDGSFTSPGVLIAGTGPTTLTDSAGKILPAALTTGALVSGITATTQSAGSNNTTLSTTAYSDNAARGTHLGTFASPDTTAGAITWTSPVLNIYTSAGSTRTYTLAAASGYTGQAFILNVAVGTGHVNVQPASGASLVLAGVLLTANHYVQAATSAPGNFICFSSDGTNWTSLGSSGTWADSASP